MNMKKLRNVIFLLVIVFTTAFILTACGSSESSTSNTNNQANNASDSTENTEKENPV